MQIIGENMSLLISYLQIGIGRRSNATLNNVAFYLACTPIITGNIPMKIDVKIVITIDVAKIIVAITGWLLIAPPLF